MLIASIIPFDMMAAIHQDAETEVGIYKRKKSKKKNLFFFLGRCHVARVVDIVFLTFFCLKTCFCLVNFLA